MRTLMLSLLVALGLGAGACGSKPCEKLAERLCEGASDRCLEAKSWVDAQGASDSVCETVLADPNAVASYRDEFLGERVAEPAPSMSPGAPPAHKPTTKEKIRNVGETIEEIGNTGEKTGEAIDKVQDAIDRARK